MRQIVLDTETTGIDHRQHRLVEIAALELVNRQITGRTFHTYINPERDIDPQAQAVHGISLDFLLDKPKEHEIVHDLISFIQDAELVIHNASFDVGFLNDALERSNKKAVSNYCSKITDTLSIARSMFPGKRNSLDALCERFGVDLSRRTKHGAMIDVELLAEVYMYMTRGQENLDLSSSSMKKSFSESQFKNRKHLIINNSIEDIEKHQEFLKEIANKQQPIWWELEKQ